MSKGTPSKGKHSSGKVHIPCRRCGKNAYHIRKKKCSSCGYGASSKTTKRNWNKKK